MVHRFVSEESTLISVLLPYRDPTNTLEAAVASILGEREVSLELIAIDDGSIDGGPAIIERWGSKGPAGPPDPGIGTRRGRALERGRSAIHRVDFLCVS